MGGFGSGPTGWGPTKRTVEGCRAIDAANLRRWGLLKPGTDRAGALHWYRGRGTEEPDSSVGYALTLGQAGGTLRLTYAVVSTGERLDYPVRLEATPCHYGGVRWWFTCPLSVGGIACGRRVRKLYLAGRYFGCRHCHDLTYTSTQQSDKRVYAALRGGLDLSAVDPRGLSVSQLGFLLKVLTFEQKRLDRLGKRFGG